MTDSRSDAACPETPSAASPRVSPRVNLAGLTWTERTTYRALEEAARNGEPCPSNIDIEMLCGYNSCSMGPVMVKRLERKGLIRVERFQRYRIVEIVATGERTARSEAMKADWPHVPKGARTSRPTDRKPYRQPRERAQPQGGSKGGGSQGGEA
ncbi:helix-turn-helix domain-containing protein [Novosphingobium pituita]|uniref:MarR family transcriptional regulator n=1 Tax=Novosphingobium pituita TaxID=3056842 RepID=A0ABQ6P8V3_9SPHN|nr:hypothetical protein [Novosphingobium sp. IK01]GMM61688.1 hypothetical protein NUTIK01_24650 [Novosphingobium sp. IK01]